MKKRFISLHLFVMFIWLVSLFVISMGIAYIIFSDGIYIFAAIICIFIFTYILITSTAIYKFDNDKIKVPGDLVPKASRVQYKTEISYDEILEVKMSDFTTRVNSLGNPIRAMLSASLMVKYIEFKCKDGSIKRISTKKFGSWQIKKMLRIIENKTGKLNEDLNLK